MINLESYVCAEGGCRCGNKIWMCDRFTILKAKYKGYLKNKFQNSCAYCQRALANDENIIIDIEHVLPKKKYKKYVFKMGNLVISCRRCNTAPRKGVRTDFIVNNHLGGNYDSFKDFLTSNYLFIHPNFEDVTRYYELILIQKGRRRYLRYDLKEDHPKRAYTLEFFQLKELEIGSLDEYFGIRNDIDSQQARGIPSKI